MLIQTPPTLAGDERQQLLQVRSYLFQMAEALNHGLNSLTMDNFDPASRETIAKAEAAEKEIESRAQTLKALIIKTANTVTASIDEIASRLKTDYVAQSEFGEYKKTAEADITANAEGITQVYNRTEEVSDQLNTYMTETSGYIKTGVIVTDSDGKEEIGIEIGDLLADGSMRATFTSSKLTFWQNGVQAAWISNGQWSSNAIDIKEKVTLGNWQMDHANGFTIRWIG